MKTASGWLRPALAPAAAHGCVLPVVVVVAGDAGATVNFDVCVVVTMLLIIVVWLKSMKVCVISGKNNII